MNTIALPSPSSVGARRSVRSTSFASSALPVAEELVFCCARPRLRPRDRDRIQYLIRHHAVDWERVLGLAGAHGVQPLVGHHLKRWASAHLPDHARAWIDKYDRMATIHNVFLVNELGRLQRQLEAHAIPSIALKGPVLAKVAYGDIHRRRYADIDLVIPPGCFADAERMLLDDDYAHYPRLAEASGFKKQFYLYLSQQCPFKRGGGVFTLDLHTRVMPPGYRYAVGFDALWERSRTVDLERVETRACAPEDMLHILSFHGLKNQWRALKHVSDVAALIEATPDMNWDAVLRRAEEGRFQHVLYLGIIMARKVFDVDLPSAIAEHVQSAEGVQAAADKLVDVLKRRGEGRELSYGERVQVLFTALHSVPGKVRYAVYSALRNTWSTLFQLH